MMTLSDFANLKIESEIPNNFFENESLPFIVVSDQSVDCWVVNSTHSQKTDLELGKCFANRLIDKIKTGALAEYDFTEYLLFGIAQAQEDCGVSKTNDDFYIRVGFWKKITESLGEK